MTFECIVDDDLAWFAFVTDDVPLASAMTTRLLAKPGIK